MKATCRIGFERRIGNAIKTFAAGQRYEIDELPAETVERYFERPVTPKAKSKTERDKGAKET